MYDKNNPPVCTKKLKIDMGSKAVFELIELLGGVFEYIFSKV